MTEPSRVPRKVGVVGIYGDETRATSRQSRGRPRRRLDHCVVGARRMSDELRDNTVGVGVGAKLHLLNDVVARAGIDHEWLVVSDDDVEFTRGSVVDLVALCSRAGLDLAQPGRSDDNSQYEFNVAHDITFARRLSRARTTTSSRSARCSSSGRAGEIASSRSRRNAGWAGGSSSIGTSCTGGVVD